VLIRQLFKIEQTRQPARTKVNKEKSIFQQLSYDFEYGFGEPVYRL